MNAIRKALADAVNEAKPLLQPTAAALVQLRPGEGLAAFAKRVDSPKLRRKIRRLRSKKGRK
jgi:hypothetical protein